jgi:integrase
VEAAVRRLRRANNMKKDDKGDKPTKADQKERKDRRRRFGTVVKRKYRAEIVAWQARYRPVRGGPRRCRNFETKKEAQDFLLDLERKYIVGGPEALASPAVDGHNIASELPTFLAYSRKVMDQKIAAIRAPATVEIYNTCLKAMTPFFGARKEGQKQVPAARLDEITPASVLAYQSWRKGQHRYGRMKDTIANATVNREVQLVSVLLTYAVKDGLLEKHPLFGAKGIKLREERVGRRWLSKDEAGRLIDATEGVFRAYVLGALTTGCRPGELKALRWGDVDFDDGRVHIYRKKVGLADALPLHPDFREELEKLRAARPKAPVTEHILLNEAGEPWQDMRKAWFRALKVAGIPKRRGLSLYSLRHSFAVHFLEGGAAVTDLQGQLGHSDLTTTQIYARMVDARRKVSVFALRFKRSPSTPAEGAPADAAKPDPTPRPGGGEGVVGEAAA